MADGMDGSATSAKRAAMLLLLDSDSSESESSSTDSSDSSDSDSDAKACAHEREFNKLFRIPAKRHKVVGFIEDVIRQYSDHEFRRHFKLARPVAEKLVAEFAVSSMCPSSTHGGGQAKLAETHVLTFIWLITPPHLHPLFFLSAAAGGVLQKEAQFLMTLEPSVIKFPADLENLTSSFEKANSAEQANKRCGDAGKPPWKQTAEETTRKLSWVARQLPPCSSRAGCVPMADLEDLLYARIECSLAKSVGCTDSAIEIQHKF
ncbi:hypothetical protein HPB51_009629 [Rhipicephalus microplus]|uniref:Uncharacterized protein n=1 Tax=Rhipicephalus microplus TaxID=6941 RepID=A0A9J6D981_RHIMP|nr:hypothetical protein HPB51_009629 [Rhipicephalus microplus]